MTSDILIAAYRLRQRAEADYLPPCPACSTNADLRTPMWWRGRQTGKLWLVCGHQCPIIAAIETTLPWPTTEAEMAGRWRTEREGWFVANADHPLAPIRRDQQSAHEHLTEDALATALAALEHPCPTP